MYLVPLLPYKIPYHLYFLSWCWIDRCWSNIFLHQNQNNLIHLGSLDSWKQIIKSPAISKDHHWCGISTHYAPAASINMETWYMSQTIYLKWVLFSDMVLPQSAENMQQIPNPLAQPVVFFPSKSEHSKRNCQFLKNQFFLPYIGNLLSTVLVASSRHVYYVFNFW